ncbi:hypothetical protein [Bacteroides uniformis]|jgi:hypothetical protein|uniref:hypothetical protein n=1 Tax=Bacteroides uniformis TaxID=820 RepID=UPI001C379520|nr:hypothetical protein [Bacteroides uniformis]MBV4355206.1 hypothetical protein [Bacteroides uniformis]MBV4364677.1 hypothetical protein [Bacteroides uniformis]MCB7264195.1 hypothetical protein [Bacteroides uniformis]MCG4966800.1 hypothetical protein [Bacteroides uniformis]MCG5023673.1 hypothetical protein [Bacteroides uniformis]
MGNSNVEEKILNIRVRYDDAIRKIAEYRSQLDVLRKREQTLKDDLKAGRISREQYNLKLSETKIATQQYNDAIRMLNKQVQNQLKLEKEQEGSLVALRAELSNATAAYDALSREEREGTKGKELQNHINAITEELKEAEEETQRFYRNVGNYEAAILKAAQSNIPFLDSIIKMQTELGGVKQAFNVGKTAVIGFSKQLLALLTNPIVAILASIAAAIMLVSKAINSSEEASNRWNIITAPLSRSLDFLLNIVQRLAGGILSVVESGAKMIGWIAKMAEKLPGIGKYIRDINDANREAIKLAKEEAAIAKQARTDQVQNAKDQLEVARLRQQAKDKEKFTAEERLAFVKQANKLEEEQAKRNVDLATREFELLRKRSEWAENDAETNDKLAELEAAKYNAEKEYFSKTMELLEQENTIRGEIVTVQKAVAEKVAAIKEKEREEIRKAEDEALKIVKDAQEKQFIETKRVYERQIEDLRIRLRTEIGLTATMRQALNQQIIALEQQKNDALQQLSEEQLMKEVENRQKLISLQLESVKAGSEQEYQLKMQQLVAQRDVELRQKELTEQMKLAITEKYNKEIDDLSVQHENDTAKKQADALKLRLDNELAEAKLNGDSELELLRMQEQQKLELKDSLRRMGEESDAEFRARQLAADQEYLDAKQAVIDKEVEMQQNKGESLSVLAGNLSDLLEQAAGDNENMAQLAKILAIAEVSIAQGVAIAKAVETATRSSATWIDMLAAIGTVVASVTTVMGKAMKSVKSAKFAQGGKVEGPGSGTSDSIPAMLSNGESVMTAAATSMFAPLLSAFNQIGGGIPINVTASSNQALGEDMLAKAVAKGMMMAPAPVVSVEEFTSVANRVKYVENLGSI